MTISNILNALKADASARVLSSSRLKRLIDRHLVGPYDGVVATEVIRDLVGSRAIHKVHDGVYVNNLLSTMPSPSEALHLVVPNAILSLQTVLGQAGVLNNPVHIYTCVQPSSDETEEGDVQLSGMRSSIDNQSPLFHAYTIDKGVMTSGSAEDNIDRSFSHPRATIERAFCDWIYLASLEDKVFGSEPPLDCDLEDMDMDRLHRIAEAIGISGRLSNWLQRHEAYLADANVDANLSDALGY